MFCHFLTATGTLRNLTLISALELSAPIPFNPNLPEPDLSLCTGTRRNLTSISALEPSAPIPSAAEPSRTSPRYLHRNILRRNLPQPALNMCTRTFCIGTLLEPDFSICSGTWCWSCTGSHPSSGLKTPFPWCCWGKMYSNYWPSKLSHQFVFVSELRFPLHKGPIDLIG